MPGGGWVADGAVRERWGHRAGRGKGDGDAADVALLDAALRVHEPLTRATHGFHAWPAALHPLAARDLIAAFPGKSVLDPFCGGGTVAVEALVAGRAAYGRDVSPIAVLIARARTARPGPEGIAAMRAAARRLAASATSARQLPPPDIRRVVERWYEPHVLCELEAIRSGISAMDGPVADLLWAVFSSILIKTSFRESDTRARREAVHRPPGTTATWFHRKAREYGRFLETLQEMVPEGTPSADIVRRDARDATALRVDLVVTSPPYPSTYDYVPMNHLRHAWLGIRDTGVDREMGARRAWREGEREARRQWSLDTHQWTASMAQSLTPGGHLVIVVGDGASPTGVIDALGPSVEAVRAAGLTLRARASVTREDGRGVDRWEHAILAAAPSLAR